MHGSLWSLFHGDYGRETSCTSCPLPLPLVISPPEATIDSEALEEEIPACWKSLEVSLATSGVCQREKKPVITRCSLPTLTFNCAQTNLLVVTSVELHPLCLCAVVRLHWATGLPSHRPSAAYRVEPKPRSVMTDSRFRSIRPIDHSGVVLLNFTRLRPTHSSFQRCSSGFLQGPPPPTLKSRPFTEEWLNPLLVD